jgi:hypothetical protein
MRDDFTRAILRIILTIVAAVFITVIGGASIALGAPESGGHRILTFKVTTREYVEVSPADLQPGHIYSHYSEQLGRQVWSICKEDKTFWHALAAGTCQPIHLFDWDVKTVEQEKEAHNQLKMLSPSILRDVVQEGAAIFVELKPDGNWRLIRTSVPMVHDAETGLRWEWQFGRYIPVRRTSDYWPYTPSTVSFTH